MTNFNRQVLVQRPHLAPEARQYLIRFALRANHKCDLRSGVLKRRLIHHRLGLLTERARFAVFDHTDDFKWLLLSLGKHESDASTYGILTRPESDMLRVRLLIENADVIKYLLNTDH
jgi:hypothetical protein